MPILTYTRLQGLEKFKSANLSLYIFIILMKIFLTLSFMNWPLTFLKLEIACFLAALFPSIFSFFLLLTNLFAF